MGSSGMKRRKPVHRETQASSRTLDRTVDRSPWVRWVAIFMLVVVGLAALSGIITLLVLLFS
jgi:hypothetical protein